MTPRSAPTVIVSRTVARENQDSFGSWVARLLNAAHRAPGYVDSFVQRPTEGHPDEWIVVYRFASRELLDAWIDSTERLDLIREGAHLVVGEANVQIVAGPASGNEARVVSSYLVRRDSESAHLVFQNRLIDVLGEFDGFIGRELLDPVPGIQRETVVILTFKTPHNLRVWMDSDERQHILSQLDAITIGNMTTNVVGGFAGWFPSGSDVGGVRKWKQALVILAALFPVTLSISLLRVWLFPDLGLLPSVLIGNILGIIVLTWVLMPPLTRALEGWLRS